MDWSKGYSASYYACVVDRLTWLDLDRLEILDGSIKKENEGLLESCDVSVTDYLYEDEEKYIRIYLDAKQENGGSEHIPLFTGLATSPDKDTGSTLEKNTINCYSVLKPAEDVYLQRGWYVPVGINGLEMVARLLEVTPAPVNYDPDSAPTITSSIIAEDDETHLTMAEKILQSINYRIVIDGDGTINLVPPANAPEVTFDPIENDVIETDIKIKRDWFECPNVFMAIDNDKTAIARDDSEDSALSTVNRGREVWASENSVELADDETLEDYALRRLKELQQVSIEASYNRRFIPDTVPTDRIRLHYPKQGLDGIYEIKSQSIELGFGAKVTEEVINI